MKKQIAIIVVLALSRSFLTDARTIDDVLEDFQPIFDEIHNQVSADQSYAHIEGKKLITNMGSFISQHSWDNINAVQTSVNDIRNQITSILTETGMIHHENLIKHCFTKQQEDTAYYTKEAHATNEVCQILGSKDVKTVDYALAEFYQGQANFHSEIETTRVKCKDSKTPLEMQTCLIEHLYMIYKPAAKEMKENMLEIFKSLKEAITTYYGNIKECYVAVGERIVIKKSPIINGFKRCVIEAANNKNKPFLFKRIY